MAKVSDETEEKKTDGKKPFDYIVGWCS